MTLIEVLIVVAIMAMVSTAVAVAAVKYQTWAKESTARTSAGAIREGVKAFWMMNASSACPTVAEMMAAAVIDEVSSRTDPWGMPWRVECTGSSVTVFSNGPDRQPETADDIRVPPRAGSERP